MDLVLRPACTWLAAAVLAAGLACGPARAAGDAARGSSVFAEQCAECHSLKEGKNKKGPSIFAVMGRRPASVAGFNYSEAMKARTEPWSESSVSAYIEHPKSTVPGGSMKYDGLPDPKARDDLIAFLLTVR